MHFRNCALYFAKKLVKRENLWNQSLRGFPSWIFLLVSSSKVSHSSSYVRSKWNESHHMNIEKLKSFECIDASIQNEINGNGIFCRNSKWKMMQAQLMRSANTHFTHYFDSHTNKCVICIDFHVESLKFKRIKSSVECNVRVHSTRTSYGIVFNQNLKFVSNGKWNVWQRMQVFDWLESIVMPSMKPVACWCPYETYSFHDFLCVWAGFRLIVDKMYTWIELVKNEWIFSFLFFFSFCVNDGSGRSKQKAHLNFQNVLHIFGIVIYLEFDSVVEAIAAAVASFQCWWMLYPESE